MPDQHPLYITPNGTVYIAGGNDNNCTVSICPVDLSVYGYRPSLGASGALIGLFAVCAAIQIAQGWRYKTWGFMTAMVLGCLDEIIGYAGRILMYNNPFAQGGFTLQIGEF
jgi:hypothetical protein